MNTYAHIDNHPICAYLDRTGELWVHYIEIDRAVLVGRSMYEYSTLAGQKNAPTLAEGQQKYGPFTRLRAETAVMEEPPRQTFFPDTLNSPNIPFEPNRTVEHAIILGDEYNTAYTSRPLHVIVKLAQENAKQSENHRSQVVISTLSTKESYTHQGRHIPSLHMFSTLDVHADGSLRIVNGYERYVDAYRSLQSEDTTSKKKGALS